MPLKLNKVFSRQARTSSVKFTEPKTVPVAVARAAYYRELFDKPGTQSLSIPQKLAMKVTLESLQNPKERLRCVPRLPNIIPRLMQSLRDPSSSARDYVEIINKDPLMASSVLNLANSVYFNPLGRKVHDIEQAVVKLGINGLRSVLSAAVMQPIFQRESNYFTQSGNKIWLHSLSSAVASEIIAEHRGVEKFKLYVLGLIHDIGAITIFTELCKQYKLNSEDALPGYEAFVPALNQGAAALSHAIAKDWDMPNDICDALLEQTQIKSLESISVFGEVLYQANYVAEIFSSIYTKKPSIAKLIVEELDLPENIFEELDRVQQEL